MNFNIPRGLLSRACLVLLYALAAICFLGGGASRTDVYSLIYVLPGAALLGALILAITPSLDLRSVRVPLLLLAALAVLILVQLIPLPPTMWPSLPGHAPFAAIASPAGIPQPWRPISLTPDLTLASLADLVVPLAALLGFAALAPELRPKVVTLVLIGTLCSAVLAIAQLSTGQNSALYTFEITNRGAAVGVFSNRNHQAVLLACSVPLLAAWLASNKRELSGSASRWLFFLAIVLLLPLTLVTGSRAGLLLLGAATVATSLAFRADLMPSRGIDRRAKLILALFLTGCVVAVVALAALLSRAEAWQRLLNVDLEDENRLGNLGTLVNMAEVFFPFGSGFGSFDPMFRYFEPDSELQLFYLNHAHNDLLELLITGGLAGALILLAFLAWLAVRAREILASPSPSPRHAAARAGLIVIGIVLLSSLVDYPLRTPLLAMVFALAAGMVSSERRLRT